MGEVANRLRACRERAYLDLQRSLHDLAVDLDPLVARVSSLEAERDELESRVESLVAQVQQLKSKEAP